MFDPETISREKLVRLINDHPGQVERIRQLEKHSCDELASYISSLAGQPSQAFIERFDDHRERFLCFGWTWAFETDHYRQFQKFQLMQKALFIEGADRLARANKNVPGYHAPYRDRTAKPADISNPVQPPDQQPAAPQGAGAVQPPE